MGMDTCAWFSLCWKGKGSLLKWPVWTPVRGFSCVGRVRDFSTGGYGHLNEVCVL